MLGLHYLFYKYSTKLDQSKWIKTKHETKSVSTMTIGLAGSWLGHRSSQPISLSSRSVGKSPSDNKVCALARASTDAIAQNLKVLKALPYYRGLLVFVQSTSEHNPSQRWRSMVTCIFAKSVNDTMSRLAKTIVTWVDYRCVI